MKTLEFITDEYQGEIITLTLDDVKIDQLFICSNGRLCMKNTSDSVVTLTDDRGIFCCSFSDRVDPSSVKVDKILTNIKGIKF